MLLLGLIGVPIFADVVVAGTNLGNVTVACVPLDQILPEFRTAFGRQDINGDGVISLPEAQQMLFDALVASGQAGNQQTGQTGDFVFNYGEPRQFRFGAELRF